MHVRQDGSVLKARRRTSAGKVLSKLMERHSHDAVSGVESLLRREREREGGVGQAGLAERAQWRRKGRCARARLHPVAVVDVNIDVQDTLRSGGHGTESESVGLEIGAAETVPAASTRARTLARRSWQA